MKIHFSQDTGEGLRNITVEQKDEGRYEVLIGDEALAFDLFQVGQNEYHVLRGDEGHKAIVQTGRSGEPTTVHWDGTAFAVNILDEEQAAMTAMRGGSRACARDADGLFAIRAPMPGRVVKSLVRVGEEVGAGQGVIVVEAMKMENELRTPVGGAIKELRVAEGEAVEAGQMLLLLE